MASWWPQVIVEQGPSPDEVAAMEAAYRWEVPSRLIKLH